jgi:hypothetical protein
MARQIKHENTKHKLAYYEYLDCRNLTEVARRVNVSFRSVHNWFISFDWEERARLYDIELIKKTEEKLRDGAVKRNLKMIKDLEQVDNVLNLLYPSVFERDEEGNILNQKGEPVKQFGGIPKLKLDLNSLSDLEKYSIIKTRIQDQIRKIEGEPDQVIESGIKIIFEDVSKEDEDSQNAED